MIPLGTVVRHRGFNTTTQQPYYEYGQVLEYRGAGQYLIRLLPPIRAARDIHWVAYYQERDLETGPAVIAGAVALRMGVGP